MTSYKTIQNEDLGELVFFGNMGAIAEYEDQTGDDLFSQDSKVGSMNKMYNLLYACAVVAARKQKKPLNIELNDLRDNLSAKEVISTFKSLMEDIGEEVAEYTKSEDKQEKKMKVAK